MHEVWKRNYICIVNKSVEKKCYHINELNSDEARVDLFLVFDVC